MIKPNWMDAPEWASYLAMDESGQWYWFEFEPSTIYLCKEWHENKGRCELAGKSKFSWYESLEARP